MTRNRGLPRLKGPRLTRRLGNLGRLRLVRKSLPWTEGLPWLWLPRRLELSLDKLHGGYPLRQNLRWGLILALWLPLRSSLNA